MIGMPERTTIQYRFTPANEATPRVRDVLHVSSFANWHIEVVEIVKILPQNENGTLDVKMKVQRTEIGYEHQPCPVCGAVWMKERV